MDASYTEIEMQTEGPVGVLSGTYVKLIGSLRETIIIIPGSGPTDRNGNNNSWIRSSSYWHLAHELAKYGISSLRIDKRGLYASCEAILDANGVKLGEYAQDICNWVNVLQSETNTADISLLGHSEGGLIGMLAAGMCEKISNVILVATPGRKFADTLKRQLADAPEHKPYLSNADKTIKSLEMGVRVNRRDITPETQSLFRPEVQNHLIDLMSYDPIEMISKIKKPVLIVQGQRDIQATIEDAKRLHSGKPKSQLLIIPEMNHVLKRVISNSRKDHLATYKDLYMPIVAELVDAVVGFTVSKP